MFGFFKKKQYLSKAELLKIKNAIEDAELNTSGEIRVLVEKNCDGYDVLDRASQHFEKLKMHKTKARNGVLIYLAMQDKQFAVAGDVGIHQFVTDSFWEDVKREMVDFLVEERYADGICTAVQRIGDELKIHFAHEGDADKNELKNAVVLR